MVEIYQDASTNQVISSMYEIEEQALVSKIGNAETCEDAIYIGSSFVAVIDGATSKTERKWDGKTGGRIAALTLQDAFAHLPPDATAHEAVDFLTAAIKRLYEEYEVFDIVQADPVQRATACFIAVSFSRKEVWSVGDCQCLLNQELIQNNKDIDTITANARSLFLAAEIAQGKTIEELLERDTGREFILPLLAHQTLFQNNPAAGQYWFPVIDGFPVPNDGIFVRQFPTNLHTIILASDGYPYLRETLETSEQQLQELLREDPLLFRKYKATKGMKQSNISFDDRAYLKLKVKEEVRIQCASE